MSNAESEGRQHAARTWGVDLSTSPVHTGVVSIEWHDGVGAFSIHTGAMRQRDALAKKIVDTCSTDRWAVDVPFGWPRPWSEFLGRHAEGPAEFLTPGSDKVVPWRPFARRLTDEIVVRRTFEDGRASTPGFSVTFDKLGATAAAWAWIEWQLDALHGVRIDRSGMSDAVRVCESYPAAAWRKWSPAKKNPASADLADFKDVLGPHIHPGEGQSWEMTVHQRDAIVCAVVARARALGLTDPPPDDDRVRSEGWIHLPTDGVMPGALTKPEGV